MASRRQPPVNPSGGVLIGRTVEARIERIVAGGFGLAHAVGRTLFVAGAAPGELVTARIDRTPGRIAFASIVELLEPSPARIEPPYPALIRTGADFQHLRYQAQLEAKVEIIQDSLRRIGGIDALPEIPITPSPREWGYRARAEWHHDPSSGALGYIEMGSRQVSDLVSDPLVVPALADTYAELRATLPNGTGSGEIRAIRAAAGDDRVSVEPPLLPDKEGPVTTTVANEQFNYDANCFFQANPFVLEPLVAEALRHADPVDGAAPARRLAIELYSGVGLFTLPLARRFERVIALESHAPSAEYAARNLEQAGLRNVRVLMMPVEDWIATAYRSHGRPPFLLVDPPRTGLPPAVLRGVTLLRPARITYVSCDPATLARDLKALFATGYELEGLAAFDMFPQTHHVEIVAHLSRASDDRVRPGAE